MKSLKILTYIQNIENINTDFNRFYYDTYNIFNDASRHTIICLGSLISPTTHKLR